MDEMQNTQTEIKDILLELTGQSKPVVVAEYSVHVKSVAEENEESENNCEDGSLKTNNL